MNETDNTDIIFKHSPFATPNLILIYSWRPKEKQNKNIKKDEKFNKNNNNRKIKCYEYK